MAAPGPSNVIAKRVVDDLLEFSGETSVSNALSFFNAQQIVEGRRFVNQMRDEVQTCRTLIGQLNALTAELEAIEDRGGSALKEIQAKEAHVDATNNSCWGRGWMSFVLVTSGLVILLIVLVYGLLGLVFKVLLSFVIVVLLKYSSLALEDLSLDHLETKLYD
ncbi:hypothetical protein Tco_0983002 [Tanacetum coccineum]